MTTYFLITPFHVYRKTVDDRISHWQQMPMQIAQRSEQIVKQTEFGRGVTVKNRHSEKEQYFTKNEMLLLALQAEAL